VFSLNSGFTNSPQNFAPVALGHARPETKWSGKISGLEFTSNPGRAGTQALDDRSRPHSTGGEFGTSTILTVPRNHIEHDVDIEERDGIRDEDSAGGKGIRNAFVSKGTE
jgi:hypothetical protein